MTASDFGASAYVPRLSFKGRPPTPGLDALDTVSAQYCTSMPTVRAAPSGSLATNRWILVIGPNASALQHKLEPSMDPSDMEQNSSAVPTIMQSFASGTTMRRSSHSASIPPASESLVEGLAGQVSRPA